MEQVKHIDKQTADGTAQNLDALYQLFPSCFTEMEDVEGHVKRAINWGKLRELLGDNVADGEPEVYDFTWVGKRAAQREAMAPIRKTLRPCPEESVNWDTTQNLYIEGDNLEVLKLLQNSYMGKVKMIYIDPPYNTGNDFVYHDDFHRTQREEDEAAGVINEEGERMIKNTESNGKFHSDWCSMIYSRLMVARSLLSEDGVIFISIDDNEADNLKKICDEVFGETNFLYNLSIINNLNGNDNSHGMMETQEYCLIYAKNKSNFEFGVLPLEEDEANDWFHDDLGYWKVGRSLKATGINAPREARPNLFYTVYINEETLDFTTDEKVGADWYHLIPLTEGREMRWYWSKETLERDKNEVIIRKTSEGYSLYKKQRPQLGDLPSKRGKTTFYSPKYANANSNAEVKALFDGKKIFDYTKSSYLLKDLTSLANTPKDAIIIDFFSGSATTAHAAMQLNTEDGGNRKFIMVQWPEKTTEDSEAYRAGYKNICEIGKERIRRAGKKIKEGSPLTTQDLDIGFRVFKCDESNYKNVAFTPKDYSQESLELFVDNIKEDRSDLDLLFDCMLRWGITLDLPMTSTKVDGCKIHNVNEGALVACFEGRVTEKVIDAICAMEPNKVVFRDSSFEEAAQKMNLFELFKQKLGWEEQEVRNNIRVI